MILPPDQDARRIAATSFERNVVVVAGAGSGKTTLLVERMLNLLLGRGVSLSSLVALTFTEKAAAEMRARLASQLSRVLQILGSAERGKDPASFSLGWALAPADAGGAGVPEATVRQRALDALHELDGSAIGTIHAFCADLLRRHPASARLDPAFVVDDGANTARVLDDEWSAFQARTLRADAPEAPAWRRVLDALDPVVVRDAAARLLEMGRVPEPDAARALTALLVDARSLRERCATAGMLGPSKNAQGWLGILRARLDAFLDGGLAGLRAHDEQHPPAWPTKSIPVPGSGCSDPSLVAAAMKEAHALTEDLLAADDATCDAVLELARGLASATRARLDAEGVVGFSELLVRARDLLGSDAEARRIVQARIAYLLLDEFQDTDPLQYEIAFLLAEDPAHPVPAGGDPWAARLLPGRLFVVGDPKQSIYRFRGADMAACERAIAALVAQGAEQVSLVANFRSREEVLEPVNDLCGELIVADPPYQPPYERLAAAREGARCGERRVEIWSVRGPGANAEAWRLHEGRGIGAELRAWRDAGRIDSFARVVVLLRAMTASEPYQRGLAEFGVPFVTQGGRGFYERDEVVLAVALLSCLARPHDAASLLAVLRSPSCGASDAEILRFSRMRRRDWSLGAAAGLSAGERAQVPLVARVLDGLAALARRVRDLPADEAVRVALLEAPPRGEADAWRPNLLVLNAASRGGAQRLANVAKLVERAQVLARTDGLSLARVVERLGEEMTATGAKQGESPLADEAVDAVRIMSVHQAKGLEFDIVVAPDVAHGAGSGAGSPLEILARDGVLGMRLPGGRRNLAWRALSSEDRRHEDAESRRTLYVAFTRAKERLIVVNGSLSPRSNAPVIQDVMRGWHYEPGADDGGSELHPGVGHRNVDAPRPAEDVGEGHAGADELALAVRAQDAAAGELAAARRRRPRSATGLKEEREADAEARAYSRAEAGVGQSSESPLEPSISAEAEPVVARSHEAGSTARAVGIAVHLALEHGMPDDPEALAALAPRAARMAVGETGTGDVAKVTRDAAPMLAGLVGSEIARRLRGARVIGREVPFLLASHEGSDWRGSIDLVVEIGGEIWVVDWKTDRELAPERHQAQLRLYAEAVRRWRRLPEPPRTALAYVALGRWVEV